MVNFKIGDRWVGDGHPVYVVAELSCNHLQDLDLARETIKAVAKTGIDAVKLQTYRADTLTLPITSGEKGDFWMQGGTEWDGDWLWNLYERAATPWEWHRELIELSRSLGVECFSSPFDASAADFLESLGVYAYKIASFEANDVGLLEHVAKKGRPVIFSTGMAVSLQMISRAVATLRSNGCRDIGILKCCSSYPANISELHLATITPIRQQFEAVVGLSDHTTDGDVIVTAVALGAKIIERHVILDRSLRDRQGRLSPDVNFSLEPGEFKSMIDHIRKVETALGNAQDGFKLGEAQKKNLQFTRSLYVKKDIKAGELFTPENIGSTRPGWGDDPANLPLYLGKRAARDLKLGMRATLDIVAK